MPNQDDDNVITINRPETKEQLKKPSFYTIVLFNDDFTPMDFVVMILVYVCKITREEATLVMMKIHKEGKGSVGRYTWEVAEDKCIDITSRARAAGHPLLAQPEEIA